MPPTLEQPDLAGNVRGAFDVIVLAASDGSMRELMSREAADLADEMGADLSFVRDGRDLDARLRRYPSARTLLLIDADLNDGEDTVTSGGRPGLSRLRRLKEQRALPPLIVLNASYDVGRTTNQVNFIQSPRAVLEIASTDISGDLREAVRVLREARDEQEAGAGDSGPSECTRPHALPAAAHGNMVRGYPPTIEIKIRRMECGFEIINGGKGRSFGPVFFSPTHIEELYQESKNLKRLISQAGRGADDTREVAVKWHEAYDRVGKLALELLQKTELKVHLDDALFYFHQSDIRIRFNLEQEEKIYNCLWESAFDNYVDRLIIETPMARRPMFDQPPKDDRDLAGGDHCLDILAIPASVSEGQIPQGPDHIIFHELIASLRGGLDMLPGINNEIDALKQLEKRRRTSADAPTVSVDILRPPRRGSQFEALRRRLSERRERGARPFDVVHFAGHSLVMPDGDGKEESRLIFGGDPAEAVSIEDFAELVYNSGVQLVYLSACQSNTAAAARELAWYNIPISIGFNWDLPDKRAVEFANCFYQHLLDNGLKVCVAFSKTRLRLSREYKSKDPVWAAPVMLAQPDGWRDIQAVRMGLN